VEPAYALHVSKAISCVEVNLLLTVLLQVVTRVLFKCDGSARMLIKFISVLFSSERFPSNSDLVSSETLA
jgi:hypothetical protein